MFTAVKKKISIGNLRPRPHKNFDLDSIKVKILSDETRTKVTPSKLQFNPEIMLGKIAKCDLYGTNNEIIAKANQSISEKTIADALKHNRLNQLFYIAI